MWPNSRMNNNLQYSVNPLYLSPVARRTLQRQNGKRRLLNDSLHVRVNLPKLYFDGNEFFSNAKPATMLEKGLKLSTTELSVGDEGLYVERDGPSFNVRVKTVRCIPLYKLREKDPNTYIDRYLMIFESGCINQYIFTDIETGVELNPYNDYERVVMREWSFYTRVAPVPFVPKGGAGKFTRKRKVFSKTRRFRKARK